MQLVQQKRIPIEQVEVGMLLDEDVLNNSGMILIPKDTILSQRHIFRLNLYQVLSVAIRQVIKNDTDSRERFDESIKEKKSFVHFNNSYTDIESHTKNTLDSIMKTGNVNANELLDIINDLMSNLRAKSDLFSFLYHLKSSYDEHIYSHSLNVAMLCNIFAQWLKLPEKVVTDLSIAGLLHDIGKIEIDKEILNKPGTLTAQEFNDIKLHSKIGYDMIKDQDLSYDIKMGILMHHEKCDGTGYPFSFVGNQINDYAKIIAIADIYDAMTSERSYHSRFSPFKVIRMFEQEAYGMLDTKYLFVFLENIAYNYLRSNVKLSTGDTGKIVFINNNMPSRPIIQLENQILDLQFNPNIEIVELL